MQHAVEIVELLIPIMALMIPLTAIGYYCVIQPLVKAILRFADAYEKRGELPADERLLRLERQIAALQTTLDRVLEEQEFQRELRRGIQPNALESPLSGD